jgi:hypothetical protein
MTGTTGTPNTGSRPVAAVPSANGAGTGTRRRVFRHPGRVAIVVIALAAVVNLGIVLLATSDTSVNGRPPLPSAITTIAPERGELVRPQDTITVDIRDDLTGVLVLDGVEIPEDQVSRVDPLSIIEFRPGPGKELRRFAAGTHTVAVRYWPKDEPRPEKPASFSWTFRAGA